MTKIYYNDRVRLHIRCLRGKAHWSESREIHTQAFYTFPFWARRRHTRCASLVSSENAVAPVQCFSWEGSLKTQSLGVLLGTSYVGTLWLASTKILGSQKEIGTQCLMWATKPYQYREFFTSVWGIFTSQVHTGQPRATLQTGSSKDSSSGLLP